MPRPIFAELDLDCRERKSRGGEMKPNLVGPGTSGGIKSNRDEGVEA